MNLQEKHQVLFINLIAMFHSLAWQQLGKVKNPATGEIERNIEGARGLIDTLEMLKSKTEGHRGPEEERFLDEALKELRLNFVDEVNKDMKGRSPQPSTTEKPAEQ
jgi:hypothetical protein